MDKEKNKKTSLGFVFGFKETTKNENNSFTVSLKNGISKKYPKNYQKKKDFYAEEIFQGDCFELYYNDADYIDSFTDELNSILHDPDFYNENYNQRKFHYINQPTKEQYFALTAFDYSALNFICKNFECEEHRTQLLEITVGQFYINKTKNELLEIYKDHRKVGEYIYNQELANLSNHFSNTNKPKI